MSIRNTAADANDPIHAMMMLADAMGGPGYIERQEAQGQEQLVNSDRLPVKRGNEAQWLDLGFTFAAPDPADPLFCEATLPQGWSRQPTDHSMWSELVDGLGRTRASIFYKAAFYDRDAFMRLARPRTYLQTCIDASTRPILDDTWLTAEVARETYGEMENEAIGEAQAAERYAADADGSNVEFWQQSAIEHRMRAQFYADMAALLTAGGAR